MLIEEVAIPLGERSLDAKLYMPDGLVGLVVVAGHDARTDHVAALFATHRLAALVIDASEDLVGVIDTILASGLDRGKPIGLFGDAAVLAAASRRTDRVSAVVTCGDHHTTSILELEAIHAPTLFVVGSSDLFGLQQARGRARRISALTHVVIVPGANAAFSEPGAIDEVADFAAGWFEEHFPSNTPKAAAAR